MKSLIQKDISYEYEEPVHRRNEKTHKEIWS